MNGAFGGLLRAWRSERGQSQLSLAMRTGVSSRHLSFLETGKSSPSREMVLALAGALEIPLRERNALLHAAGFAALYRETPLDAAAMGPVREAVKLILDATEPNPTFVVNRRYDVLDANASGRWLVSTFTRDLSRFASRRSSRPTRRPGRWLASRADPAICGAASAP
jgi:transcriptional regulator with XRE-family HTH domain